MSRMRNIRVVAYDPLWSDLFQQETMLLRSVIETELISIHHIGSTAIPGLCAKPVIDIMPVVRSVAQLDVFDAAMTGIGYASLGEFGIPGRRHFVKGSDDHRTHHLHCYEPDHPEVARHLDFRDYLIAHAEEAREYAHLKLDLARQFPNDIESYMQGKDGFIKQVLQRAHLWRQSAAL